MLLEGENIDEDTPAKIYQKGNLIDIDCGCIYPGGKLGCLCLDTMEEFYVEDIC